MSWLKVEKWTKGFRNEKKNDMLFDEFKCIHSNFHILLKIYELISDRFQEN